MNIRHQLKNVKIKNINIRNIRANPNPRLNSNLNPKFDERNLDVPPGEKLVFASAMVT